MTGAHSELRKIVEHLMPLWKPIGRSVADPSAVIRKHHTPAA
jgi:hypothetical protein